MARYVSKPARMALTNNHDWSSGTTGGGEVHEDGSWSEDQPTGLLDCDGQMIYRVRTSIGFLADN